MKNIAVFLALFAISACTQPNETTRLLEAQGYTDINIKGYAILGCSKDDDFHTEFTATAANGQRVSGVACGALLKGTTIRFF